MPPEAILYVRVQPRASRDRITLLPDGSLKIWCSAPPVDGQANDAVRRLLAKALGVAPSRVEVLSGESSKSKRLRIDGLSLEEVLGKLD